MKLFFAIPWITLAAAACFKAGGAIWYTLSQGFTYGNWLPLLGLVFVAWLIVGAIHFFFPDLME